MTLNEGATCIQKGMRVRMNWKRHVVCLLVVLAATLSLNYSPVAARTARGGKNVVQREAKKAAVERGSDKNIKVDRQAKTAQTRGQAPPAKGGARTRGIWGQIHVDNRTYSDIDIFIDGVYAGTVGSWGDLYRYVVGGGHVLYGSASEGTWGPRSGYVPADGTWTWELD
jgi:hypothetical protein